MKIVVLDGHSLNPGDLSWCGVSELADEGEFICYERTAESELLSRAQDAEIIFTNKTPLNAEVLSQLPKLTYIGVLETGTNVFK